MSRRRRTPAHPDGWTEFSAFEAERSVRWQGTVLAAGGDIELQQLEIGEGWSAEGPGGAFTGELSDVVRRSAADGSDPAWTDAVIAAIKRELIVGGRRRHMFLVKRANGIWFHATRSENRESIRRFGLDWKRMGSVPGIAGSSEPEWPGVYLCQWLQDAHWFARMPRRDYTDIWAARLNDDVWLEGAHDASGGGDDHWMICSEPIAADRLELIETDIPSGRAT
jgi:hypothetical protein